MRTIIDLPEEQLEALSEVCRREGISRAEAIRQAGPRNEEEADVLEIFVRDFRVVETTRAVARSAVGIRRTRRLRLPDAIIWATARAESALLVTRNTKDFPVGASLLRRAFLEFPNSFLISRS